MNLGEQSPTTELFDSAVRYLHMLLLRELRPPWLAYKFPQALSGEGVLSRYTRPSFLQWPIDVGAVVFGEGVVAMLRKVTSAVGVDVAGLLARPMYACTNIRGHGGMCMSVASMSEFVQQGSGRGPYLCQECVASGAGVPVSDSKPLRILHLYALVSARDGGLTPLRMKAVRMVLRAPPANWAWRVDLGAVLGLVLAQPAVAHEARGRSWRYSDAESDAIWRSSGPFRGEVP